MEEDEINKVETILGYLEYLYGKLNPLEQSSLDFIGGTIEEANEWIAEVKAETPDCPSCGKKNYGEYAECDGCRRQV